VKTGIITQVRMTSTRLPGKVLKKANGKPLLKYHIDRLRWSGLPVYIATTTNKEDDIIAEFARSEKIPFYRGSEPNVLSRYYECARANKLNIVVRVTSDCPLIDGYLIKDALQIYVKSNIRDQYLSNAMERTYPRGFDFEIFSFDLLEDAYQNATLSEDLEHVTPYINRNRSGNVQCKVFTQKADKSNYRITVDAPDDYELIKTLIEKYGADKLSYTQITNILDQHPELSQINAHIKQKKGTINEKNITKSRW